MTNSKQTRFILHERQTVASTNDEARGLAENGAPGNSAVWALEQTAGRGRRGREWASPPGNLYVSLLLRPECKIAEAAQLSLVAALGLGDAISEYVAPSRVRNKWPNDVLVDGRKIAGLLLESSSNGGGAVDWVVVGCGVNVANSPDLREYAATSLNAVSETEVPVRALLETFLERFEERYQTWHLGGIAPIREAWLERAHDLGQNVTVRLPTRELHGIFEGMDQTGALILALADGAREIITSGDVFTDQGR